MNERYKKKSRSMSFKRKNFDAERMKNERHRIAFYNDLFYGQNYEEDREKFLTIATYVVNRYDHFILPPERSL